VGTGNIVGVGTAIAFGGPGAVFWMWAVAFFGAVKEADLIWQLGDIGVGMMAWVTVLSLLILCPKAIKALQEFEKEN